MPRLVAAVATATSVLVATIAFSTPVTAAPSDPTGYELVATDGGMFPFGNAGGFGSTGNITLNQPIVGMAMTPDNGGYWLVASDGGIFPFGNAGGFGSTGNIKLNQPIVGMAATPDGGGYWLVASDGGIFPFGDATGLGSTGSIALNKPIVGMASTPDGFGYWLVASDGGIFPFGTAGGFGSTGNIKLNKPIVGMSATFDGLGYWLVASDGGIFPFGDAIGYGSTGNIALNKPVVGMEPVPTGGGYWLVASDGGIFPFGRAADGWGSTGNVKLNKPIVGMAGTRKVIYSGPIRYTNHCGSGVLGTSVTNMNATATEKGCQTSFKGGHETTYRNCGARGTDLGSFTYTKTGGGPTFNGSYLFHYIMYPGNEESAPRYRGFEVFVDTTGGTLIQEFSVPVTFDASCNATPAGQWSVHVLGSGDLAFLSSNVGPQVQQNNTGGSSSDGSAWSALIPQSGAH